MVKKGEFVSFASKLDIENLSTEMQVSVELAKKSYSDYHKLRNKNQRKLQYIKYNYNVRLKELEEFKSYFIESIIESRSFAELKQYIIDRYGVD